MVDEGLLDGALGDVVGLLGRLGVVVHDEREVLAGTRVVGVRDVAEDLASLADPLQGTVESGAGLVVDLDGVGPRRGGLGDVADQATVEHVVTDVGGVVLLLVVQRTRSGTDTEAAMLLDDLVDQALLVADVSLRTLEADEAHGDLLEIPLLRLHDLLHGLARELGDRRLRFLAVGHDVLRLDRVRDASHHRGGVGMDDLLASLEARVVVGEEVGVQHALFRDAMDVHPGLGDDAEAALGADDHLADARP